VDPLSLLESLGIESCKISENKMSEAVLQKRAVAKKAMPIGHPSKKKIGPMKTCHLRSSGRHRVQPWVAVCLTFNVSLVILSLAWSFVMLIH
jgi:hypothetical protein